MKKADLLKKAPGQFKNLHPCTESVPAPCPVSVTGSEPAWFFLGFVVDWVKVYRYPLRQRPESAQWLPAAPRNVAMP